MSELKASDTRSHHHVTAVFGKVIRCVSQQSGWFKVVNPFSSEAFLQKTSCSDSRVAKGCRLKMLRDKVTL